MNAAENTKVVTVLPVMNEMELLVRNHAMKLALQEPPKLTPVAVEARPLMNAEQKPATILMKAVCLRIMLLVQDLAPVVKLFLTADIKQTFQQYVNAGITAMNQLQLLFTKPVP